MFGWETFEVPWPQNLDIPNFHCCYLWWFIETMEFLLLRNSRFDFFHQGLFWKLFSCSEVSIKLLSFWFPALEISRMKSPEVLLILICLKFQTHFSPQLHCWFESSILQLMLNTCRGLCDWEIIEFVLCIRILTVRGFLIELMKMIHLDIQTVYSPWVQAWFVVRVSMEIFKAVSEHANILFWSLHQNFDTPELEKYSKSFDKSQFSNTYLSGTTVLTPTIKLSIDSSKNVEVYTAFFWRWKFDNLETVENVLFRQIFAFILLCSEGLPFFVTTKKENLHQRLLFKCFSLIDNFSIRQKILASKNNRFCSFFGFW